jgi:hypothetical protein
MHSSNTATKVVEGSEPVLATSTGVGSYKEVRLVTAKDLKYSGRPNPGTLPIRLSSPTQDLTRPPSTTQDLDNLVETTWLPPRELHLMQLPLLIC